MFIFKYFTFYWSNNKTKDLFNKKQEKFKGAMQRDFNDLILVSPNHN